MKCFPLSVMLLSLVLAGCGGSAPTPTTAPVPPAPAVPPPLTSNQIPPPQQPRETLPVEDTATATAPVVLDLLPWEGVQELIAGHKGKVVVVDLWATYCVPCRAEFPGLVELSHADPENIVCISVSLDDPDDEAKAREFLVEQQATMQNVLCTTESDVLYDEILQIGGIPAVYVYDRDGVLAKVFTGPTPEGTEHTYHEHIAPFARELASQK
jgi:thiol-disulfide isomerase/thioredoxin